MKILYYTEPKTTEHGPDNVAWHLLRILSNRIDVTYIPSFTSSKALNLFDAYGKFASNQIDVIHFNIVPSWVNGTYPLLNIANIKKTPSILNIHGLIQMENTYEHHRFARSLWLDCFNSLKRVHRVIVNSEYMKNMITYFYRLNPEKIVVIPNGIDFENFSSSKSRIELEGNPAILSVSRVCMLKGFGTMVEAVSKLKDELPKMKVHLVGDAAKEYRDMAKRKGVDNFFVFHGCIPHSLIPKYLKSADFGIYGSILYEGFGISLVEAMASGLPVIASDIDTYQQIINNGKDGLLYRRANGEALSDAILTMNNDPNLRKNFSINCQKTAAQYDWPIVAEKYASLYEQLANTSIS
jgi:glycosyltransferase involved in cell wall biosynthesis